MSWNGKNIRMLKVGDVLEETSFGSYFTVSEVTGIKETDDYYRVEYKKFTVNKETGESWGSSLEVRRAKYPVVNGPKKGQHLMEDEAKDYTVYNCSYRRAKKDPLPSAVLVWFSK